LKMFQVCHNTWSRKSVTHLLLDAADATGAGRVHFYLSMR